MDLIVYEEIPLFEKMSAEWQETLHGIRSKEELNSIAACVYPDQQIIVVREDIYDDLVKNDGRARFTIAHELSHVILKHDLTLNRDSFAGNH